MVKPSDTRRLRKSAYALRSFLVSVGKSKKTMTHMMRYSLKRSTLRHFGIGNFALLATETAVERGSGLPDGHH